MDPSLEDKVSSGLVVIRTSVFRGLTWMLRLKKKLSNALKSKPQTNQRSTPSPDPVGRDPDKGWFQALKDSFTDIFEIPDEEMGWFIPAVWAGIKTVRSQNIDVIYATGRPWTAFLIGRVIKALTGKPLVVDFRDPWMTNPFRLSYSGMKDTIESYMERKVVEGADLVIANTETLREEFLMRFPNQDHEKFVTVLNGFDPEDFVAENKDRGINHKEVYTLTHTGFLYGKRDPKEFLLALQQLIESKRIETEKIQVVFLGATSLDYDLEEYLATLRLDQVVRLYDHKPFQESLSYLKQSDGLLLLQPGTTTQIPSKLFEYIGLGKPILAICPDKSATERLMKEENLGIVVQPESSNDIADAIWRLYKQWEVLKNNRENPIAPSKKFNIESVTSNLARTLNEVSTR